MLLPLGYLQSSSFLAKVYLQKQQIASSWCIHRRKPESRRDRRPCSCAKPFVLMIRKSLRCQKENFSRIHGIQVPKISDAHRGGLGKTCDLFFWGMKPIKGNRKNRCTHSEGKQRLRSGREKERKREKAKRLCFF